MKHIRTFDNFKQNSINEEFIGGLFKNLKNKLSLSFSKQFGNAKKADKLMEEYKNEVIRASLKKKEALKAYSQYIKDVKDGGEKDDNKLKTIQNNLQLADKNCDKQVELIKQKFDIKFKEIVDEEKNPKIQNYITLKKIEMQQDLLNSELNILLTDVGLKEEDVKSDPFFSKLLLEIKQKSEQANKMTEEQKKALSSKDQPKEGESNDSGFDMEAAKKSAEEDKVFIWNESPFKNYTFQKDEEVTYFSKTNYLADKNNYKGTVAKFLEDKGDRILVQTKDGKPEINKGSIITSQFFKKEEEKKEEKKEEKPTEL